MPTIRLPRLLILLTLLGLTTGVLFALDRHRTAMQASAYRQQALLAQSAGLNLREIHYLRLWLQADEQNSEAMKRFILLLQNSEDKELKNECLHYTDRLLTQDPDNGRLREKIIQLAGQTGRYRMAERYAVTLQNMGELQIETLEELAKARWHLQDIPKAIALLRLILNRQPNHRLALVGLQQAAEALGDRAQAEEAECQLAALE
jgi:tetratricopeptide (TPR) repeat protein